MDLKLYYHPLASYCWKVLITLYEADAPFERCLVDLADDGDREELLEMSPFGKFPALRDVTRDRTVLESSIVNEYLCGRLPSAAPLLPSEPEAALDVRARDRFFDLYVMDSMAKIVDDRIRPSDAQRDPWGVQQARERLDVAYPMIESFLAGPWATGDTFTLADCSAAPRRPRSKSSSST